MGLALSKMSHPCFISMISGPGIFSPSHKQRHGRHRRYFKNTVAGIEADARELSRRNSNGASGGAHEERSVPRMQQAHGAGAASWLCVTADRGTSLAGGTGRDRQALALCSIQRAMGQEAQIPHFKRPELPEKQLRF